MNQLDALKLYTTVVADTGDFQQIGQFHPQDATTNPSLILKAVLMPQYQALLQDTLHQHPGAAVDVLMDHLLVRFGCEILKTIKIASFSLFCHYCAAIYLYPTDVRETYDIADGERRCCC